MGYGKKKKMRLCGFRLVFFFSSYPVLLLLVLAEPLCVLLVAVVVFHSPRHQKRKVANFSFGGVWCVKQVQQVNGHIT